MEREFTRNVGRNFSEGDIKDYPLNVWEQIARSIGPDVRLDDFSRSIGQARRGGAEWRMPQAAAKK